MHTTIFPVLVVELFEIIFILALSIMVIMGMTESCFFRFRFFGAEPPLLELFLKKLGYEVCVTVMTLFSGQTV